MSYHPAPPEKITTLSVGEIGIEETRGAPRPWIFEREQARRRRRAHTASRIRGLFAKIALPYRTR
jgi:hypothetical protein